MRCAVFAFLLAIISTWSNLVRAEPASLEFLPGEWHQIISNAGKCADCRIVVGSNGQHFTVKSNNGWSATVRPSFEGKPFVAGKGSWERNVTGVYGGKAFFLNLGMKDDQLLMLMTVPGRDGTLRNIKAIFEREARGDRKESAE
jgi:hypothetical protein